MRTFATLFSGGELAGVGLQAAGLRHLWGVEYDPEIAVVAEQNGFSLHIDDVRAVDYASLESPDWLHMSPVCKNASVAKSHATEESDDIETAGACVRAITALRPRVVSLENVWRYRTFEAFKLILRGLHDSGYHYEYWHLNAADYGVPQTRKRLILVARQDVPPAHPWHTHHKRDTRQDGLMSLVEPDTAPWIGWYEAIEDLIPTLPASEFAPWQLERLPMELLEEYGVALIQRHPQERGDGIYPAERPAKTIEATGAAPRAFLVPGGNASSFSARQSHEPARAIGDTERVGNIPRAFILSNNKQEYSDGIKAADEPAHSITQSSGGRYRALARGRVVKMTPRALARFQSVPDWYELPGRASLACTVIGNGVPCLLMQRVAESVT